LELTTAAMTELRVPLYPSEQKAQATVVTVTGASGFVAGPLVQRLLAAGHTVHATVRDANKESSVKHLKALPGADKRLKLFSADLLQDGSFDAAVSGAHVVFHTASPYKLSVPKGKEREELVEPALKGTENLLSSVDKAPSVKRVVLTSSVAAVYGDPAERGKGHVFTEADWNTSAKENYIPYYYSKTMAEKRAWELQKGKSWDLVTVLPGAVFGPPLSDRTSGESVNMIKAFLSGSMWPAAPPFGLGVVDVEDVAATHALAAFTPSANGRYLASPQSVWMKEIGDILRTKYPDRRLPKFGYIPYLMIWAAGPMFGMGRDFIKANYGKIPRFDSSRAERELGIKWTPASEFIPAMAEAELKLGIAK